MIAHDVARHARILGRIARTSLRHARAEWSLHLDGVGRGPEVVLLILGCQRSGTTMVTRILSRDPDAKVYPEHSGLTWLDFEEHLRLSSVDRVADRIGRSHFPMVVLKPLVESQNALALLDGLPNAHALWMFRHWTDVARSNLARFGRDNGIRNLRRVVEARPGDWRAEGVDAATHAVVAEHFSESMNPWDAAALFWWVRNTHFFSLGLAERPGVMTCPYEDLVADPNRVLRAIYRLVDRPFPGSPITHGVRTSSVGLGEGLLFSPEVAARCDAMWARLRGAHERAAACA
jgi:hypothetical protein